MNTKTLKKKIDYEKIKELAEYFCTGEEIADILEIEVDTLKADKQFRDTYKKTFSSSVFQLRKTQFTLASEGNTTMLSLLGKLYLGQRDNAEVSSKALDYDLTKLPDFFLERIIKGEDPVKVINEYENASSSNTGRSSK